MSEYIEIGSESTDNPSVMIIHTNLALAVGDSEKYDSMAAMEEGSAVAQALATIEGIVTLQIKTHDLIVEYDTGMPWHIIETEISTALKDFFL
jgi:hypothetical protein